MQVQDGFDSPLRPHESALLDTPVLRLDIGVAESNIRTMARAIQAAGKHLRPHVKGHKTPLLARKQVDAGAVGIACAKLSEAEVMVLGGISDILLTTEIVGAPKLARLTALAHHAELTVVLDDLTAAQALSAAAVAAGVTLNVLVDVNVGQNRCGVLPGHPAVALARALSGLPGLRFRGLQGYEGHLQAIRDEQERRRACQQAMRLLTETRETLERDGIEVTTVTTGGTGTHAFAAQCPAVTEVQPGSYVVMDADYARVAGLPFQVALSVLSTVVSRPADDRVIIDAGHKALSSDAGPAMVRDRPQWGYTPKGDEHGQIQAQAGVLDLQVGDIVELIPSHCDTTINLYDAFHVLRDGRLEGVWPIAARGRTT